MKNIMNTPYAKTCDEYIFGGWNVIVLPLGKKFPPPKGTTGSAGAPMDEEAAWELLEQTPFGNPMGNIALVMPDGVIGIDVDGPAGYETFLALQKQLGDLPLHVVLSSHTGLTQGFTAYFRVPLNKLWRSGAGKNIDIIQRRHRYSVAPPSIHPSGSVYDWFNEFGAPTPIIPSVEDCPELPAAWLEHLEIKEVAAAPKSYRTDAELSEMSPLADLSASKACSFMNAILDSRIAQLKRRENSRHHEMVLATMAFIGKGAEGHKGAGQALAVYRRVWGEQFTTAEHNERNLTGEFMEAMKGAEAKVDASHAVPCDCGKATPKRKKKAADEIPMHQRTIVSGLACNRMR